MKSLTSAVFYSTDKEGRRYEGLSQIPQDQTKDRPLLFVSNHQLVGIDSWLVVNELLDQCDIFTRALTHPFVYPTDEPDGTSFLETFGCLPVSTRNFYRLLQTNQPILLFPGGAKESFINQQSQAYALTGWTDDKTDFVRAAAKFGATIVPFSSVGAAESALFWEEVPVLSNLAPSLQGFLQTVAGTRAPTDARYDSGFDKRIPFPLVLPKPLPCRHYFLFAKPVELAGRVNYKDRQACEATYRDIKQTIQYGCRLLVKASQQDPFYDPLRRLAYEQVWRRQAPSFPIQLLNERNQV